MKAHAGMNHQKEINKIPEASLKTSLAGKVRNLRHFKSEALLPLFEAIANSIHAIEELGKLKDGYITVRIKRESQLSGFNQDNDDSYANIIGFEIEDNGVGFNDQNFDSFQTAESIYKEKIGGKGIGRFLWLKAFHRIDIDSIYCHESDDFYNRKIAFSVKQGIEQVACDKTSINSHKTVVSLNGFSEDYRSQPSAYKTTSKIAQRIFENLLTKYISNLAPKILVIDEADNKTINLDDLYSEIKENIVTEKFTINDVEFTVHHIRLYGTRAQAHKIVYCAHGRDVKSRHIGNLLGSSVQFDDSGKKFFYSVYVTSSFLDTHVDEYRQEFLIQQGRDLYNPNEICMDQIEGSTLLKAKEHLAAVIKSVEQQKTDRIAKFVQNESPMLRAVVKYCPDALKEIELNITDEKLNQTLYAFKGKAEYEMKKKSAALLKTQSKSISEISVQYAEFTSKIEEFQKDQLAGYLIFRKMIIDLLDKKLELNTDGTYHNEDIVHDIVFPRKTDTDSIEYENHNLWLIDEILSFHTYAVSDKKLCDYTTSESEERPDIVVFSEYTDDRRARAISIVEFKKPGRKNFDEDPTKQLFRYVREIRKNGFMTNGKEFAENADYAILQGERGYYSYNRTLNAHVEIIGFDKIVFDAKQRHRAFFEKLGIKN